MSKISRKVTATKCDVCRKISEIASFTCLGCGKDVCYECHKGAGIEYTHGVHFGGSGDGYYCNRCDGERRTRINRGEPPDPLHRAYLDIHNFKLERARKYQEEKAETKRLEKALEALL